ncbi:MAG: DNA gyrase/topoisomerase IV subunit A [Bacteroidia bacterium]|nr:DNA gyrase/topoisomerase IV subunit A [Bacteroidia bacterium]
MINDNKYNGEDDENQQPPSQEINEEKSDIIDSQGEAALVPEAGLEEDKPYNPEDIQGRVHLSGMYKDWFLDYASYVILERAVPHVYDGLKPVQRRILYSMFQLDDGRFHKVANIIGHTMQYHPHGDASINDALVQIGQKNLLIDTQGNWGNIFTGDSAAAPRYIEARLSKFALDVVFNSKTTFWKSSYDSRHKEPIALPVKFPLLLAEGSEGIAVGLASKILPHNFIELLDACINILKGKEYEIFPDFPTGGLADCSKYNAGVRGGKVRVRAKIEMRDKKTLVITEPPYSKTTNNLIDSIISANEKGKIKIRKIDDNTAEKVEIIIHLAPGASPDKTIDALYAFTDCEISVSPNACIIEEDRPRFISVNEILEISVNNTTHLLRRELEIKKYELEEELHFLSLEKIFIEEEIYLDIRKCKTWEAIILNISQGLKPFLHKLHREVSTEDIIKLTELHIRRISKYDSSKADENIRLIKEEINLIKQNLLNLTEYAVEYFRNIKKKYSKGRERKTELRSFETIVATKVAAINEKLYVIREEGFFGTSLKKDEFVCECSDIDDIIIFRRDGKYLISKVSEKSFAGKDIIYIAVFNTNDNRTIYNAVYRDGRYGNIIAKRFPVTGIVRDKEYDITQGTSNSKILYFSGNPNGEAEIVKIYLKPRPKLKKLIFEFDFSKLLIKGRNSIGYIITKHDVHKIVVKEKGASTLGGCDIWFDNQVFRLNTDKKGIFLGTFLDDDKILVITQSGYFRTCSYDLNNHFEDNIAVIEKFDPAKMFSAVYYDADLKYCYLKRFHAEEGEKKQSFIGENPESQFILITDTTYPKLQISFGGKNSDKPDVIVDVTEFIGVKSYKAKGKRLSNYKVKKVWEIESN